MNNKFINKRTSNLFIINLIVVHILLGQIGPDVNMTVLPSTIIPEYANMTVICDADVPPAGSPAFPPLEIVIRLGIYTGRTCGDGADPVYRCVYTLRSFFPGLPRDISCTAENSNGECRTRVANITLVSPG